MKAQGFILYSVQTCFVHTVEQPSLDTSALQKRREQPARETCVWQGFLVTAALMSTPSVGMRSQGVVHAKDPQSIQCHCTVPWPTGGQVIAVIGGHMTGRGVVDDGCFMARCAWDLWGNLPHKVTRVLFNKLGQRDSDWCSL